MMSTATDSLPRVPIEDWLFSSIGHDGRLIGSRCRDCTHIVFPRQESCPGCGASGMEAYLLAREGILWTWTLQNFRPKEPFALPADEEFVPYGVGYVELPGEVRVETRLTVADADRLKIGMPMRLTFVPLWVENGQEVVTFAFAPSDEEVSA